MCSTLLNFFIYFSFSNFDAIDVTDRKYRDYLPTYEQKDVIASVAAILQPFSELTDLLSGEKCVTISSVVPILSHIFALCYSSDDDDANLTDEVERDLRKNIHQRIWAYIKSK